MNRVVKVCNCCDRRYTAAQFLALSLPQNGREVAGGRRFRLCECTNTLALPVGDLVQGQRTSAQRR